MSNEYSFKVVDALENEIKVGMYVKFGIEEEACKVMEISEPDADYDDELGRGVQYCPKVKVRWKNGDTEEAGTYNITKIGWQHYPDGPMEEIFQADDLEVADA